MEWITIDKLPKEKFGWFAVATVPRKHSGTNEKDQNTLDFDNTWRESFGFSKAWYNNRRFYEMSLPGRQTVDITEYVTHWGYLPKVPKLERSHHQYYKLMMKLHDKPTKEELIKIAMENWELDQKTNPTPVNPHAYSYGFLAALRCLGIL